MNTSYNKLIEDSKGNKLYLYYKEYALYYKYVIPGVKSEENILSNEMKDSFVAVIDKNDYIYIACYSNSGEIHILSYKDECWKLEDTISTPKDIDISLLELFIIKDQLHIIYATNLPIVDYFNVYHTYKYNSNWKKENIAEIHSADLYNSYSCSISMDGTIHFINIVSDRKSYLIKYNKFINASKWVSDTVSTLNNNNIYLSLFDDTKKLHLICYSIEEKTVLFYYFTKSSLKNDSFEFEFLTKIKAIDFKYDPLFYIINNSIYMAYILGENYFEYILNTEIKEWEPYTKIPLNNKASLFQTTVYKNKISDKAYFCYFDELNKIILPSNSLFNNLNDNANASKLQQDYYVPYLLDQIKLLSDEIKSLSGKLEEINQRSIQQEALPVAPKENKNNISKENNLVRPPSNITQSDFKNVFMKSDTYLSKLDSDFAEKFIEPANKNSKKGFAGKTKMNYASPEFLKNFKGNSKIVMKNIGSTEMKPAVKTERQVESKVENMPEKENESEGEALSQIELKEEELPKADEHSSVKSSESFIKKFGDLFK